MEVQQRRRQIKIRMVNSTDLRAGLHRGVWVRSWDKDLKGQDRKGRGPRMGSNKAGRIRTGPQGSRVLGRDAHREEEAKPKDPTNLPGQAGRGKLLRKLGPKILMLLQ